jgi:hypothetical protein
VSARAAKPGPAAFDAQDVTIATLFALLAQLAFVAVFSLPSPKLVEADISNDNARPIAVAITPVLKLGSKTPTKLPSQWQRKRPVAAKSQPAALPSPQAEKTVEAIPKSHLPDASVAPSATASAAPEQPNLTTPQDDKNAAAAASTEGSEQGAANGTETDPLKGRALDMYKAQLAAWFQSRFHIRGKIPFDTLKSLRSTVVISVTPDRKLEGFSITKAAGDGTFDAEVKETLSTIQSSGAELPAPPPMYPEFLSRSTALEFKCTIRSQCE